VACHKITFAGAFQLIFATDLRLWVFLGPKNTQKRKSVARPIQKHPETKIRGTANIL